MEKGQSTLLMDTNLQKLRAEKPLTLKRPIVVPDVIKLFTMRSSIDPTMWIATSNIPREINDFVVKDVNEDRARLKLATMLEEQGFEVDG